MRPGPPLVVIAGPTASGKSAAAQALAEASGAAIVSCDSLAVYRGFDIGTAKPTAAERARVPHHLVDVVDPEQPFHAADYVALADAAIAACRDRGRPVIVCGGTALYLKALLGGLFAAPSPDPALRRRLKGEAARLGWPALHARLAAVDATAAARIAPGDPVRIERALEVYEQTGVPISVLQAAHAARGERRPAAVFIIDPPSADHDLAIAARTDRMLAAGLVEETARLAAAHQRGLKPFGALGYKEALAHLDGDLDLPALREAIRVATRRFARRQRTFFRKAWPAAPAGAPASDGARWVHGAAELLAGDIRSMIDALLGADPMDADGKGKEPAPCPR
jgi:tRNA dimethylallyltransferase